MRYRTQQPWARPGQRPCGQPRCPGCRRGCAGGQGAQLTQGGNHLVIDQAAGLELLAAVDHAVADGIDLCHVVDALALASGHLLHDLSKCLGVGGEDRRSGGLVAVGVMGDHAALHADALAQAFAQHLLAIHVDQLILQRRRSAVNNQNFHLSFLPYFLPSGQRTEFYSLSEILYNMGTPFSSHKRGKAVKLVYNLFVHPAHKSAKERGPPCIIDIIFTIFRSFPPIKKELFYVFCWDHCRV